MLQFLQRIGKALMLPIAVLPAAGIVLRLGSSDMLDIPLMVAAGGAIFDNLPLIFAIGVAIAANRNPACRCAQVAEPLSAKLARAHNDANAIALGARLIGPEMAKACVSAFLSTDFLGDRHQRRVDQLSHPEQENA